MHYEVQLLFEEKPNRNPRFPDQKIVQGVKYLDHITDLNQIKHLLNNVVNIEIDATDTLIESFGSNTVKTIMDNFEEVARVLELYPEDVGTLKTYRKTDRIRLLQSFFEALGEQYNQKWYDDITKTYGADLITEIEADPYPLYDQCGLPIQVVDKIGVRSKLEYTPERIFSIQSWIFGTSNNCGDLYLKPDSIQRFCSKHMVMLDRRATQLLLEGLIKIVIDEVEYYTAPWFHIMEQFVETYCDGLLEADVMVPEDYEKGNLVIMTNLIPEQRVAVDLAIRTNVSIITGPPGTGKSYVISQICNQLTTRTIVLAPTGTAVENIKTSTKRLCEGNQPTCKTIHSFLACDQDCDFDTVCIDEMSMVSLDLFYKLLQRLYQIARGLPVDKYNKGLNISKMMASIANPGMDVTANERDPTLPVRKARTIRLVLCGDKDQLPSIQGGYVFGDLIEHSLIPYVELTEQHRAENKKLIVNAKNVLEGLDIKPDGAVVSVLLARTPAEIESSMWSVLNDKGNNIKVCNSSILIPLRRKGICTDVFNIGLQNYYNKHGLKLCTSGNFDIRLADKLINRENDYDKKIYNGSILTAKEIVWFKVIEAGATSVGVDKYVNGVRAAKTEIENTGKYGVLKPGKEIRRSLTCVYHENEADLTVGEPISFQPKELKQLELAYATTIHAAQGKGYDTVLVIIHSSMYFELLSRKILYTALTRAKKRCFIIADQKGLDMCKRLDTPRITNLYQHWRPLDTVTYIQQHIHTAIAIDQARVCRILKPYSISTQHLCIPATEADCTFYIPDVIPQYKQLTDIIMSSRHIRYLLYKCIRACTAKQPVTA